MTNMSFIKISGWLLLFSIMLTSCAGSDASDQEFISEVNSSSINHRLNEKLDTEVDEEEITILPITGQTPPPRAELEFITDFSIHSVDYNEILSGGPPKDGIAAISNPEFETVDHADRWLDDLEPVILLNYKGEVRAYPIQILIWHEIVNDEFGDESVIVTFCPLCNTAIVFNGMIDEISHSFGTTGRLRYSNLIMYDHQTETWWQQATGTAIAGELTGTQLEFLPASIVSWQQFKDTHPDSLVLSIETGYIKDYGNNPYPGYDDITRPPFLYSGPKTPEILPATARVITVDLNGEAVAYAYDLLSDIGVANDIVGGKEIVVFWQPGVASALDTWQISDGRDIGAVGVFSREKKDQVLTFSFTEGKIVDDQTNSEWNIFGKAIGGEFADTQLGDVVSINHFWFSWAAFRPETRVFIP